MTFGKEFALLAVVLLTAGSVRAAGLADWNFPESGVSLKGEMSFTREKDALKVVPCPEGKVLAVTLAADATADVVVRLQF